jgi:hypothetical protein
MSWGQTPTEEEHRAINDKLIALRVEHRDLDDVIARLEAEPVHDQLQLRRMKKRKLALKDQITWLERQLQPDEPA